MNDLDRRSAALLALPALFAAGTARAQALTTASEPKLQPAPMAPPMDHAMPSDMGAATACTG